MVTATFTAEEKRHPDRLEWRFTGATVTEIRFDAGGFRFHVWTPGSELMVRLATPLRLHTGGHVLTLDPEQTRSLEPLLSLLGTSLTSAVVSASGDLTLCFSDAFKIEIAPHPLYEAWESGGSGEASQFAYLCGPGGGSPWGSPAASDR